MKHATMARVAAALVTLATATAALAAGASGAGAVSGSAGRTGAGALARLCDSSFDPYQVPQSTLHACGEQMLPRQRTTKLPGGGAEYDYGSYTLLTPPAHFDVLTASDQRLAEYGFPTRKELGAQWYPLMRHVRSFTRPTPYLVAAPRTNDNTDNQHWAGYNVNSHTYTGVSAYWVEPGFVGAGCSGDEFSQWTGIGGIKADDLGQDGTTFNQPDFGAHQGFIETIDIYGGSPVAASIYATPHEEYYSQAFWVASENHFSYYMENVYTGATYSANSRQVTPNLDTAEVITERPVHDGSVTQLSDFQSVGVLKAEGYWANGSDGFYSLSHNSDTMVGQNGQTLIANPGPIVSGSDFTVYWDRCQG